MSQPNIFPHTFLYTADATRSLENAILASSQMPALKLMHRAANCALLALSEYWPNVTRLHIFCGGGNNGGDGYTMAALAAKRGLVVTAWQLSANNTEEAYQYALQEGVDIKPFSEDDWCLAQQEEQDAPTVIVDALLGIGSCGELRGPIKQAVELINKSMLPVFSVDVPTGINADTGAFLGPAESLDKQAVKADATISFIVRKVGTLIGEGRNHAGKLLFNDLGVVEENSFNGTQAAAHIIDHNAFLKLLPSRASDAHKGSSGHVLVIGGDIGFGGAPLMAAQMAARTGAGLVGVATQSVNVSAVIARQPELMAVGVESGQMLLPLLKKPTVLVVGPGLGQSAWSEQLLYHALGELTQGKKLVIDADALNLLASGKLKLPSASTSEHQSEECQWVLTPHPGEAARLLNTSIAAVQADRIAAINALQHKYGGTIVLKGAGTLVLSSDKQLFVCNDGNAGMATGGMGDVLSGLIGSFIAQGLTVSDAACLGVVLHAVAGDLAVAESGMRGLLATDLIPYLRMLLDEI